ncbi:TMEM165/GDT1 family protein [Massilia sp. W12]|uniref:TMEM165/GDT1 family protein n=1 Tax=Massilia sp. W12 TaxID=3126507 RepID=UPI0030CB9807
MMEALILSTLAVTLAEIGDKTQLLAFMLATRFRRPVPIMLGILAATLANHGLAGLLGSLLAQWISPLALRIGVAVSFLGMAAWILIPDELDEDTPTRAGLGVFGATFVSFFLAEMGDKTQFATITLAAHYESTLMVIAGTTLGMLIADVPAIFIGQKMGQKLPLALVQRCAALLFALLGLAAAWDAARLAGWL